MPASTLAPAPPEEKSILTSVSEPEFVRASYLRTESSLKTLGAFFLCSGGLFLLSLLAYVIGEIVSGFGGQGVGGTVLKLALVVVGFAVPAALFQTGRKLLRLEPDSRKPAVILAILGLFAFPVGTILNIGILSFLSSGKVAFVLSDSHSLTRHRTPHIRSRISRTFIVCMIVLGLLIVVPLGFSLAR